MKRKDFESFVNSLEELRDEQFRKGKQNDSPHMSFCVASCTPILDKAIERLQKLRTHEEIEFEE